MIPIKALTEWIHEIMWCSDTVRELRLEDLSLELVTADVSDLGLLLSRKACVGCALPRALRVNQRMVVRFG